MRTRIGLSPAHSVDNESGRASLKLTDSETSAVFASEESRAAKTIREVFESGRPLTYIRSAEEQRVAKMLREVATRLSDAPRDCLDLEPHRRHASRRRARRGGHASPAERSTSSRAHPERGHLPPEGLSRAIARISGDPAPPARRLRQLPRPAKVRRHHLAGALHSRRGGAQPHVPGTPAAGSGGAGGVPAGGSAANARATRSSPPAGARAARTHAR